MLSAVIDKKFDTFSYNTNSFKRDFFFHLEFL